MRVRVKQLVLELIKMFTTIFAKLDGGISDNQQGSNLGTDFASEAESELDNLFR